MLHEVLVALAGFPSSLDRNSLAHPAEADILDRAQVLGRQNAKLRESLANARGTDAILVPTLETEVATPLLQHLARIERSILNNEPTYGASTGVSLARIMTDVVDLWTRPLNYAVDLMSTDRTLFELIDQLRQDSRSGYPDIALLASKCLASADAAWVRILAPWWTYGIEVPVGAAFHPALDGESSSAVFELGNVLKSMRILSMAGSRQDIREVLAANQAAIKSLAHPIEQASVQAVLSEMQARTYAIIRQELLVDEKLAAIEQVIRKIVLLGSSDFCQTLHLRLELGRVRDFESAELGAMLRETVESSQTDAAGEMSVGALEFSEQLDLEYYEPAPGDPVPFSDLVFGRHAKLVLDVTWPYDALYGPADLDVYKDMFGYLATISVVKDSLPVKVVGSDAHHARVFYNSLWLWFQTTIATFTDKIKARIAQFPDRSGPSHLELLRDLARKLMLGSRELRKKMRAVLQATVVLVHRPESPALRNAIAELVIALRSSRREHVGEIPVSLEAFAPFTA